MNLFCCVPAAVIFQLGGLAESVLCAAEISFLPSSLSVLSSFLAPVVPPTSCYNPPSPETAAGFLTTEETAPYAGDTPSFRSNIEGMR